MIVTVTIYIKGFVSSVVEYEGTQYAVLTKHLFDFQDNTARVNIAHLQKLRDE
jgi:hypothetical protein